jgi:hypothetical protein
MPLSEPARRRAIYVRSFLLTKRLTRGVFPGKRCLVNVGPLPFLMGGVYGKKCCYRTRRNTKRLFVYVKMLTESLLSHFEDFTAAPENFS